MIVWMLAISCLLRGIGPIKFFEKRLLAWCGKMSDGAYVYHVPLLLIEMPCSSVSRHLISESKGNKAHEIYKSKIA